MIGFATAPRAHVPSSHPSELLGQQAAEAGMLFERYGALAAVAHAAIEREEDGTLAATLAERDRLAERLGPLVAALVAAQGAARRAEPYSRHGVVETLVTPVLEAARHAQAQDARLGARVEERRGWLAREMERVEAGGTVAAAYLGGRAHPAGATSRLDVRR